MQRHLSDEVQKKAFNVLIAQEPNYHSTLVHCQLNIVW